MPKVPSRHRKMPRHRWLYALPEAELPATVTCRGQTYEHVQTFKHDFFAATGLYRGPEGLAVLKLGRRTGFAGFSLAWIGEFLTRREIKHYKLTHDLPGVPRLIGPVGKNGLLHAYVPGHPLDRDDKLSDTFFDELDDLVTQIHNRHMAYVDLNKRQNVLLGDDGKPHLIDFQISLHLPPTGWRRLWPVRWLLARFQHADRYHCLKHKRRLRPDLLIPAEREQVERLSIWIRLHRRLSRPLTNLRRATLRRLAKSETTSVVGSDAK